MTFRVLTAFCAVLVLCAGPAVRAFATEDGGAVVLAQNDGSRNQDFWSGLFNKSGKSSKAKPLFLDRQNGTSSSRSITPYNMARYNSGVPETARSQMTWEEFEAMRHRVAVQQSEEARAGADVVEQQVRVALNEFIAKHEAELSGQNGAAGGKRDSNKKMVYDPAKAWSYHPNQAGQTSQDKTPRIFNTR